MLSDTFSSDFQLSSMPSPAPDDCYRTVGPAVLFPPSSFPFRYDECVRNLDLAPNESLTVFMTGVMRIADFDENYVNTAQLSYGNDMVESQVFQLPPVPPAPPELHIDKQQRAFSSQPGVGCVPADCSSFTGDAMVLTGQDRVVYQITVTNSGGSVANNVEISDTLPAGFYDPFITNPLPSGCSINSSGVQPILDCSYASLPVGGSLTLVITGSILSPTAPNDIIYTNTATVSADNVDCMLGANTCMSPTIELTRLLPAQLSIDKSVSPTQAFSGDIVTYTIVYANTGHQTGLNISLEDMMPAELDVINVSGDYQSIVSSTTPSYANPLILNIGSIPPDTTGAVQIQAQANGNITQ